MKKNLLVLFVTVILFTSLTSVFGESTHDICPEAELLKVSIFQAPATKGGGTLTNVFFEITIKNVSSRDRQFSVQVISDKDAMENFFPAKQGQSIKAGEEFTAKLSVLKDDFPDSFTLIISPVD